MMRYLLCVLFYFACIGYAFAQQRHRVLIVLDASVGMSQALDGNDSKFRAAGKLIMQLIDSVYARNSEVEFGLRAFGQQYPVNENNCFDTKLEVQFSMNNYTQMGLRLNSLRNIGRAPVAFATNEALDYDAVNTGRYIYHIILITGKDSTCDGDLCKLVKKMADKHIPPACIIGVGKSEANDKYKYNCIGSYKTLNSSMSITKTVNEILNECCRIPYLVKGVYTAQNDSIEVYKPLPKEIVPAKMKTAVTKKPDPIKANNAVVNTVQEPGVLNPDKMGFLKLINLPGVEKIRLYYTTVDTNYRFYCEIRIGYSIADKHIKLPVGKFRLLYNDGETDVKKEFIVRSKKTVEISL
ncbi:MAG: VWA domain-containing protein [Bacteroidetes bacterium]|nr:VWA domain-containing protein [Bacteroidota bacterium]